MQLGEPPQLPQFVEWHFAVQISRPDGGSPSDHDRKLGVGVAVTAGQVRTSNHSNSTLILGWETSGSCCGICILKDFSILLSSLIITPSTLEWAVPSSYLPPFFSATYCFQTLCFHHQGQWHSLEISSIYTPSRPTFSKRRQCSILFHHGHWVSAFRAQRCQAAWIYLGTTTATSSFSDDEATAGLTKFAKQGTPAPPLPCHPSPILGRFYLARRTKWTSL